MKKRVGMIAGLLVLFLFLSGFSYEQNQYVYTGDYLNQQAKETTQESIETIRTRIQSDVLIVFTEARTGQADGRSEAESIVNQWVEKTGGYNENGQTILFLVNMTERYYFIDEYNRQEKYLLENWEIDEIVEMLYDSLSAGNMEKACSVFLSGVEYYANSNGNSGQNTGKKEEDSHVVVVPDVSWQENQDFIDTFWGSLLIAVIISFVITLIVVGVKKGRHAISRNYYMDNFRETRNADVFTGTTVVRRRIETNNGSSGGGGHTHSSGGSSGHHGGGGHF